MNGHERITSSGMNPRWWRVRVIRSFQGTRDRPPAPALPLVEEAGHQRMVGWTVARAAADWATRRRGQWRPCARRLSSSPLVGPPGYWCRGGWCSRRAAAARGQRPAALLELAAQGGHGAVGVGVAGVLEQLVANQPRAPAWAARRPGRLLLGAGRRGPKGFAGRPGRLGGAATRCGARRRVRSQSSATLVRCPSTSVRSNSSSYS